jgi:hypothetical protein
MVAAPDTVMPLQQDVIVVPHPSGPKVLAKRATVPVACAVAAIFFWLLGHYGYAVFAIVFGVWLFLMLLARMLDPRPQAVLRSTGIEIARYWPARLEHLPWAEILAVSDIASPRVFTLKGRALFGDGHIERDANFFMTQYFAMRATSGRMFKIFEPGHNMDLGDVRRMVLQRTARRRATRFKGAGSPTDNPYQP